MYKNIGITETGDAALNLSWVQKIDSVAMAVLITKNPTDTFIKKALEYKDKVVIHLTCTGMGHTVLEQNVPRPVYIFSQYDKMLDMGFRPEQFVLRIDPIIPTQKGIKTALNVLAFNEAMGDRAIKRIRFSFLDMYNHVIERFKKAGLPHPYGSGFNAPQTMMDAAFEALMPYAQQWQMSTCAEAVPAKYSKYFKQTGCISADDVKALGLNIKLDGSSNQRKGCMCPSNKTELLSGIPGQCAHACLYCFWKNDFTPNKPDGSSVKADTIPSVQSKQEVEIWTDGGSTCNGSTTSFAGWGAMLIYNVDGQQRKHVISGYEVGATNNQMELTAVIKALKHLKTPSKVTVYSDSAYVVNAFGLGWLKKWKKCDWKDGQIKNIELWKEAYALVYESGHDVTFEKVKGHAGIENNEYVDKVVEAAMVQCKYEFNKQQAAKNNVPEVPVVNETIPTIDTMEIPTVDEMAFDSFEIPHDLDTYEESMPVEEPVKNETEVKKEEASMYDENGMFLI